MKRGGQIRGRRNATDKVERKILPERRLAILVCFALSIFLNSFAAEQIQFKQPTTLKELLALPPADLEKCDIARMNLLCAEGLPGAENLNVDESLAALDQWAQHIKSEIARNFHHYGENPPYYYNSTNFYAMLMMSVVLYDDYKIRYNPKWIEAPSAIRADDHFAADSRDLLIHGLVSQRMGTCSSMPVLYVALARRLGYPVKLVTTKTHLFMRWDSPAERFDMDATGKGMDEYTDEYYKKWPFPVTDEEIKADGYLKSLTPAEELSIFLRTRAMCLREAGRIKDAIAAHAAALRLEPNWRGNQFLLAEAEHEYAGISSAELQKQPPPKFQPDDIDLLVQQVMAGNRLRRAELGIPEQPPAMSFPK